MLIELLSTKNAGHKDSSANINKMYANDAKCETDNANSFYYIITYYTVLIRLKNRKST